MNVPVLVALRGEVVEATAEHGAPSILAGIRLAITSPSPDTPERRAFDRLGEGSSLAENMPLARAMKEREFPAGVRVVYQSIQLASTAMGLGSCPIGGGDSEAFARAAGANPLEEVSVGELKRRRDSGPWSRALPAQDAGCHRVENFLARNAE